MHTQISKRSLGSLALALPFLFLTGCLGTGDGPDSIAGTPATEVPQVADGFCDAVNFEVVCVQPGILNFNGGVTTVIDNPDQSGINTSDRVAQMTKRNEETFGGTRLNLASNVDFSAGLAFTMKVRASRSVPVLFKLEHEDGPAFGPERVLNHSGSGDWEELCFDFAGTASFSAPAYTVIFDNGVLGQVATDPDNWTFEYDDILQQQSCDGAADPGIQPAAGLFLTSGSPSLAIPDDYTEITAFGSGSVIDPNFADDDTYSPVLSVFSGTGYGANVAQVGFIGFRSGFLGEYQTIDFKVKGDLNASNSSAAASQVPQTRSLPSQIVFVKLFDGVDALRINLTSSGFSEAIENGWFQVSIPLSSFDNIDQAVGIVIESDDSAAEPFRMLLTDLGFSGDGGNAPIAADPGVIPDEVIYSSNSDEMIDIVFQTDYTTITGFDSGSVFDDNVVTDDDFRPALAITTGDGYGAQVGQYALLGFESGFVSTYGELVFKAKNLNNDIIRINLLDSGEYLDIDLKMSAYSTALGNGWSQVVIPVTDLVGADTAAGLLFETDNTAAESFTFLLTDFGFNNIVVVEPEIASGDSVFSQDANVMSAQAPPDGLQNFGSGATFETLTDDPDYDVVLQVNSGNNFGGGIEHVGFVAFTGYPSGFASGYETLNFKVKGDAANLTAFEVKFFPPDVSRIYDITDYEGSTLLSNGWYQVSIPLSDFEASNAAVTKPSFRSVTTSDGFLIGPQGDQGQAFSYRLTDIGFTGTNDRGGGVSTDPIVFADNFGTGVTFAEFGGSINNLSVDTTEVFNGAASLRIEVPAESYTGGALVVDPGRDVSGYDVLTFWAKASAARTLNVVGIGNDAVDSTNQTEVPSLALTTTWAQFTITIPDPSVLTNQTGLFHFAEGSDEGEYTIWLDDIQYEVAGGDGGGGTDGAVRASFDEDPALFVEAFGGASFGLEAGPAGGNGSGNALRITRNGEVFAGLFVEIEAVPSDQGNQTISAQIFSPAAGIPVVAKLDFGPNMGTGDVQANETVVAGWQTLTWTFTNLDPANSYTRFVILPNLGVSEMDVIYYVEDVTLVGATDGGGDTGGAVRASFDEDPALFVEAFGGASFGLEAGPAGGNGSGNALRITRNGEVFAGLFVEIEAVPSDQGNQTISAQVFSPIADIPVVAKLDFGPNMGTGDVQANETVVVGWQTLTWTFTNLDAANSYTRFVILPNLGTAETEVIYYFENVTLAGTPDTSAGLAKNSGFETGDFTDWETFDNGGTIAISTPGSTSGSGSSSSAANLNISVAGNPTLKQTGIGAGQLGPNQEVNVSFDWKGSAANGGVVDIRIFSELGGDGGVTKTDIIQEGGVYPADWTTAGPITITTAATATDIAGGLTIQVTAICGAVDGCVSDLFIDNIIIEVVGDGGNGDGGGDTGGAVRASFDEDPMLFIEAFGGASFGLEAGPAGGNGSGNALRITRNGEVFAGLFVEIAEVPSDQGNQTISAQVFSPAADIPVVAKLDFGPNMGTGDVQANETVVAGWQTLTWTFTNLDAANSYTRFVILPNLGVSEMEVVYYVDDVTLVGATDGGGGDNTGGVVRASFDEDPALFIEAFGGASFGLEAGPAGGNGSNNALRITRNGEVFAGLFVEIAEVPSDQGNQTISAQVFSPTAEIPFVAKLDFGPNMGTGDVQANEAVVAGWQTLTWTFANLDAANSYTRFVILPNLGTSESDVIYYVDDVTLVGATDGGGNGGDPGGGDTGGAVVASFDEDPALFIEAFGGASFGLEPGPAGGNGGGNALRLTRNGEVFAGLFIEIAEVPNDQGDQTISAQVFSPAADIPVVAKLEFASNMGTGDVQANETVVAGWQTLTWTFTNLAAPNSYTRFVILPNLGTSETDVIYYIDDVILVDASDGGGDTVGAVVASFDEEPALFVEAFGGASFGLEMGPAGGTGSGNALRITRNGEVFAGLFVEIAEVPSDQGNQMISAQVFSPAADIPMVAKLDFGPNMGTGDVQANETVVAGWQTLTWTFTNLDAANSYTRFVILPNLGTSETDVIYYVDDVTLVGASDGGGDTGGAVVASFDEDPALFVEAFGGASFGLEMGPAGGNGSGNALRITRNGEVFAGLFVEIAEVPSDQGNQTISAQVFSPAADIPYVAKLDFGPNMGTGDVQANEAVVAGWQTLTWTFTNLDPANSYTRFVILPNLGVSEMEVIYYVDDVTLAGGSGGNSPDPSDSVGLVANSDFETGDFAGWETINNGGTITISSPGSTGDSAANLNAPPGNNPTLKQTEIGKGQVLPNEQVTVSFDWKGTAASGGVIDIQLFSETAGGGVTKADLVQGGDGFPADWTTVGPLTFTTAADVGDGLTIQVTAICGAVEGCVSDLFIDNIIITRVAQ